MENLHCYVEIKKYVFFRLKNILEEEIVKYAHTTPKQMTCPPYFLNKTISIINVGTSVH